MGASLLALAKSIYYYKPHLKPLDQKTCDPILVTVIKMQPRKLIVNPVVKM